MPDTPRRDIMVQGLGEWSNMRGLAHCVLCGAEAEIPHVGRINLIIVTSQGKT